MVEFQGKDTASYQINILQKQLNECKNKIKNIMSAIEAGIFTDTTKDRLVELEEEKEHLTLCLTKEKNKRTLFSREHIIYWLELFRDGNLDSPDFRDKFFNMFVNHVVVYEDHIVVALNLVNKEKAIDLKQLNSAVRLLFPSVELTVSMSNPSR